MVVVLEVANGIKALIWNVSAEPEELTVFELALYDSLWVYFPSNTIKLINSVSRIGNLTYYYSIFIKLSDRQRVNFAIIRQAFDYAVSHQLFHIEHTIFLKANFAERLHPEAVSNSFCEVFVFKVLHRFEEVFLVLLHKPRYFTEVLETTEIL